MFSRSFAQPRIIFKCHTGKSIEGDMIKLQVRWCHRVCVCVFIAVGYLLTFIKCRRSPWQSRFLCGIQQPCIPVVSRRSWRHTGMPLAFCTRYGHFTTELNKAFPGVLVPHVCASLTLPSCSLSYFPFLSLSLSLSLFHVLAQVCWEPVAEGGVHYGTCPVVEHHQSPSAGESGPASVGISPVAGGGSPW